MFLKYKILNLSLQYSNIIVRLFKAETTSFLCLKYFKATIFKWLSEHLFARWPLIATLTAIILKGVSAKPRHLHAILYNSLLLRSHRINYKQYWYSTAPNCFIDKLRLFSAEKVPMILMSVGGTVSAMEYVLSSN